MTLKELCDQAHKNAKEKGWWNESTHNIPEKLALIHSEISESLEEYRKLKPGEILSLSEIYFSSGQKPEGFGVELADTVIRIADLCGYLGIDLEKVVQLKMKYNKTRSYRHGGKIC